MIHWLFVALAVYGAFCLVCTLGLVVLAFMCREKPPETWPDGRPVLIEALEPEDFK